jgi:hypothetical protein
MAQSGSLTNAQPYGKVQAITKSDVTVYAPPLDALLVNGTGDVAVVDAYGNTVTITSVVAGALLPIRVSKVLSTGTDATEIFGLTW